MVWAFKFQLHKLVHVGKIHEYWTGPLDISLSAKTHSDLPGLLKKLEDGTNVLELDWSPEMIVCQTLCSMNVNVLVCELFFFCY